MMAVLLVMLVVFIVLAGTELVVRRLHLNGEFSRKFIHMAVGSFAAFWPFFLSRPQIVVLSIVFLLGVVGSQSLKIFAAIHSVQRATWGEVFFAISVGVLALVAHTNQIYLIALLTMSIADALAAIIGVQYGRTTRYHVFGHAKSVQGTATFLLATLAIFVGYSLVTGTPFNLWFIPIAVGATLIENLAVLGFDNLFIPLMVAVCLNLLS